MSSVIVLCIPSCVKRSVDVLEGSNNKCNNAIALNKLKSTCEQISRMIGRVSGKHGGIQECETLRLVEAFVISRITYAVPYRKVQQNDLKKLDNMIK